VMGQLRGSQNSWGVSRRRRVVIGAGTHLLSGSWAVVEGEVVRLNAGCGRRPNSSELPIVCWKAQARLRSPHMTPRHQLGHHHMSRITNIIDIFVYLHREKTTRTRTMIPRQDQGGVPTKGTAMTHLPPPSVRLSWRQSQNCAPRTSHSLSHTSALCQIE
jgi:hypothetical protein